MVKQIEKQKINLGMGRALFNRVKGDFSVLNIVMLAYLVVVESGWKWWYLILFPLIVFDIYMHLKKLVRQEWDFNLGKSKQFQDLKKDVISIKKY